jgi:lysozyme family protein
MSPPAATVKTVPERQDDRFARVLAHLLKTEGGYNDIPADRGGATNFGISLRFAQAEARIDPVVRRALDMDMDGDVDGADIRLLTPEAAAAVYRRCFWDRYRCAQLRPRMDGALFDQAVNGGSVAAVRMLQQAVNLVRGHPDLVVDGRIGPRTIAAANKTDPNAVVVQMRSVAAQRYRAIVRADPRQRIFLKGWLARANTLGNV